MHRPRRQLAAVADSAAAAPTVAIAAATNAAEVAVASGDSDLLPRLRQRRAVRAVPRRRARLELP